MLIRKLLQKWKFLKHDLAGRNRSIYLKLINNPETFSHCTFNDQKTVNDYN